MKNYRLVYVLATKSDDGTFDVITEYGEFHNRAAAHEFVKGKTFDETIYLFRKEVATFFDCKLVDKTAA